MIVYVRSKSSSFLGLIDKKVISCSSVSHILHIPVISMASQPTTSSLNTPRQTLFLAKSILLTYLSLINPVSWQQMNLAQLCLQLKR